MQPHTSYLVCGTPRSGSSLLCEALVATGIAGQPEEYFLPENEVIWQDRWGTSTFTEYFARTMQQCTTPDGVFGMKMMWGYFDDFVKKVQSFPDFKGKTLSTHHLLQTVFPNLHYIWIKRRDKVRQAVSHAKARQTNIWKATADSADVTQSVRKPVFSFEQIDFMVQELEAQDAAWQQYFNENNVQPFVVEYEDFVPQYEEVTCQLLYFLGIPDAEYVVLAERSMKKQADEESEQWVQLYLYLKSKSVWHRCISYTNTILLTLSHSKWLRSLVAKTVPGSPFQLKKGLLADKRGG